MEDIIWSKTWMVYRGRAQACRQSIRIPKKRLSRCNSYNSTSYLQQSKFRSRATCCFYWHQTGFWLIWHQHSSGYAHANQSSIHLYEKIWELTSERKCHFYFDWRITHQGTLHTRISQGPVLSAIIFSLYLSNIN